MCSARCKCQDCKNTATSNEDPHSISEPESETDSEEDNKLCQQTTQQWMMVVLQTYITQIWTA